MHSTSPQTPEQRAQRRRELIALFWKNGIMQRFREDKGNCFQIRNNLPTKTVEQFLKQAMGDSQSVEPEPIETVCYYFEAFRCADVMFGFVTAEGHLIVEPFRIDPGHKSRIPLFEAERVRCSPFR